MRYYCTTKRGSKRIALAALDADICLSLAEAVFHERGFSGMVCGGIEQNKNYAGLVGPVLAITEIEARQIGERQTARRYREMGQPWENFRDYQRVEHVTEAEYNAMSVK
jgi:hypothetical protein